jgi:hypothetical protein
MTKPKKKQPLGQSIGGVLFGFEQQIFRNQPPPHELVHHARPDDAVAAADGGLLTIELPRDAHPGADPGADSQPARQAIDLATDPEEDRDLA